MTLIVIIILLNSFMCFFSAKYLNLKDNAEVNKYAELASPDLSNIGGPFCLSFNYYFPQPNQATLRIFREAPQSTPIQIDEIRRFTGTG